MTAVMGNKKNYIGYEYRDVTVNREMEPAYIDGYTSFGWSLEKAGGTLNIYETNLKLKRDRKIVNKSELARLQRQFESSMKEIETMEKSKTLGAATIAYIVGIIGTAFMAGSVFAVINGMTLLCIILGIPGFLCWGLAYVGYLNIRKKRTERVEPLIEQKYDEVYEVCEKASSLLV